ncbi:hypothetical protein D1114_07145 [Cereibacter sphaeroides]|uniref:Uncharacterized protein n=1 Tax=Cereibacter sphaeroides TaxID=1063 RepID=A0AAX1UMU6_CERSP|nr:hypothetical protein [Cereibacter sphaeroides]RHZ96478.1 hypothetical protein D1114_07145 [Cereibacter sphaeroides]
MDVLEDDEWQATADVVGKLRARVTSLKRQTEVAYYFGLERLADENHRRLIDAEWELMQAEEAEDLG